MNLSRVILSIALCFPAFTQQEVLVVNAPKAPALVQQAPAEPFVKTFSLGGGSQTFFTLITIPAKKRLVIESISVSYRANTSSGNIYGAFLQAVNPNLPQVTFHVPTDRSDLIQGANLPMMAQANKRVRWYVEPNSTLHYEVVPSGFFAFVTGLTISGYFVDVA
jgi:hypothetical protein